MANNDPPTLLVLLTALLTLVFSPALSAILAPYAVILAGALIGTGWGLIRRPADAALGPWGFVVLMVGTALIFTMPAAVWVQRYTGANTYQWLLAPLAAVIGAVGNDWPRVGAWVAETVRTIILRKNGVDEGKP
jgi:hypothetical protein